MKFSMKNEIRSDKVSTVEYAMKTVGAGAKVNVDIGTKRASVESRLMPEKFLVAFEDDTMT